MISLVRITEARFAPGRRLWLKLAIIAAALLGILLLQFLMVSSASAQELIPADVTVAGVPVGGLDTPTALATLEQHFAPALNNEITLTLGSRVWTVPFSELGARLDLTATLAQAFSPTLTLDTPGAPRDLPLILTHDQELARVTLDRLGAEIYSPAVPADIVLTQEKLELTTEISGTLLDTATTWLNVVSATDTLPYLGNFTQVVTTTIAPTITAGSLTKVYNQALLYSGTPITLTAPMSGTTMAFTVQTDALRSLITLERDEKTGKPLAVDLPDERLTGYVTVLAERVDHKVEDARLTLPDYAIETVIEDSIPGRKLDLKSTAKKMRAAITTKDAKRTLALPVTITAPKLEADALADIKSRLDTQLARSLELRYRGQSYMLTPKQLVVAIYLNSDAIGSPNGYSLRLEDKDLERVVKKAAAAIDVAARDATYRLVRGRARLVEAPTDGLSVDQAASVGLVRDAMTNGTAAIDIPVNTVKPGYAFGGLSAIATPDLLGEAQTFYGYSSPERSWNVTLGASRLDGWYVAPGAIFSFNDALGPLTLNAGFKMGWAIQVQGGSATTIPSEAGGICQVATTLFQSTFWSGLQITDRRNHSYWIASYGKKPYGLQGLDATVAPPWQDFKFRNNTGNWLLVRAHGDGADMKVKIYGTNPGWEVKVGDPVITNVVQPDMRPVRETSDQLAAGRELKVETAGPGFKSSITRQVIKDGQMIEEYVATGSYLPSRDRWMVGTGKATTTP